MDNCLKLIGLNIIHTYFFLHFCKHCTHDVPGTHFAQSECISAQYNCSSMVDFNFSIPFTALEETLVPASDVVPSETATSLGSRTCHRSRDSLLTPMRAITNVKSKSLSSLGSLDTDVIELQNHVTFGQGVKV